ncbi:MAG: NAD(P)H-hydrate dehydratase [Gammaproteobacteria bacterium]|nr:NAD(P)H-hydrate dehydratase [Gammaproteobacteria bacterium]
MDHSVLDSDYRTQLPINLYSAEQTRALDHYATQALGIAGLLLMERAGLSCFKEIEANWPEAKRITIVCGHGNNGGDGYVIAALAKLAGMDVTVLQLGAIEKTRGDALLCQQRANNLGVPMHEILSAEALTSQQSRLESSDVVVDALLGTGINGAPRGLCAQVIQAINLSPAGVLAVDTPSGLCMNTGWAEGEVVNAQLTVTFIACKQGLLTGAAANHTGTLLFDDLRVPQTLYLQERPSSFRLELTNLLSRLPARLPAAHKGSCGHVLVIGGAKGMGGAAVMAAMAATRVGAGLVSIASPSETIALQALNQPELMCQKVKDQAELDVLIQRATALVIGPGLGQSEWSLLALKLALDSGKPCVVDADALNLLSETSALKVHSLCVLTPHPKEASRLVHSSTDAVQKDRFKAVKIMTKTLGATVILKGSGTLISDGENISLLSAGGPAMASGGMGDVLSGVIGGLMAQGCDTLYAAQLGASLHASAADKLAENKGVRGMLATDLIPLIRQLLQNPSAAQAPSRK